MQRSNVESKGKIGIQRLSTLAEKLVWMRDNLPGVVGEDGQISKGKINALVLIITNFLVFTAAVLELVNGFLSRFDDELEQINIKQAIGGKNRRNQHSSRVDAITHTMKTEKSDFEGCGIELPG